MQARASFERNAHLTRKTAMSKPRPHISVQANISAASVPARGGFTAMSIQDYTRISNERTEFLNFLLAPNPSGIPSTEFGVLKAA